MPPLTQRQKYDRQISEAQVQRTITDALDTYGWLWHHETDSRKSKAGFPDICAVHQATGALLFLEIKTETGRVRDDQHVWLACLSHHGPHHDPHHTGPHHPYRAMIVRPSNMDEALHLIRVWSR